MIDNLSSAVKVGLIVLFILGSGIYFGLHSVDPVATSGNGHQPVSAFTTAFYMFTGFSFLPIAAKQMKNPEKTLPRALVVVMIFGSGNLLKQLAGISRHKASKK
nr:hypothetical protein [uncultured Secundilactobacillus sp.]